MALTVMPMTEANRLLVEWGHKLGACNRPFSQQGWSLELGGEPISVAVSASAVSATVGGYYRRTEVVECARLCSRPDAAWATRIMLRLWREVCAQRWVDWEVRAAISYSHNGMHTGDLYRFAGWTKVKDDCGSSGGGGTWTNKRATTAVVMGRKTLWVWRYG